MNPDKSPAVATISFCEPYIERLTDVLLRSRAKGATDFSRTAVLFGGKRPALFLKREMARRLKVPFYPPHVFTIDEWMTRILREHDTFSHMDDLDAAHLVYELVREQSPELLKNRASFARFLPWARELVRFIEQLDLELIENEQLRNVEANAEIGYDVPGEINSLLKTVMGLRASFHEICLSRKTVTRGLRYLLAARRVEETDFSDFDRIIIANFFYFHKSEELMARSLIEAGRATLLFQGDERKWPVLRRSARLFGHEIKEGAEPDPVGYRLRLYRGFDLHSQIGMVRSILKEVEHPERTVIVLPQADHLVPLLSEIAPLVEDLNVSLGYPFRRSSLFNLIQSIFRSQLSRREDRYYTRDYLTVLQHPFLKNYHKDHDAVATRVLVHKLEEILTGQIPHERSGQTFLRLDEVEGMDALYRVTREMLSRTGTDVSEADLKEILRGLHDLAFSAFSEVRRARELTGALETLIAAFMKGSPLTRYPLNKNIALRLLEMCESLGSRDFSDETFPREELFRMTEELFASDVVAFKGSPLKGLQILGLFETRSLNFETVIVLDVCEGTLPRLKVNEPLVPREVMISLNLDRLELEEQIQRYQFMRLISSARDVHLVYQESRDKERSRFVEELIWEEQKKREKIFPEQIRQAAFHVEPSRERKSVPKTPEILSRLETRVFSASSVNTYLRNPMEFYETYVLGLKEKEDLLDEPESRQVGVFMHELLHEAFQPFIGKRPEWNPRRLRDMKELFAERYEKAFGTSRAADSFLLKRVMEERWNRFLENESQNSRRDVAEILHLEERFEDRLTLGPRTVRFSYIVDRIDRHTDGTVWLLDYKTGNTDLIPRQLARLESGELDRETVLDTVRSFQLPLYFHHLIRAFPGKKVNAALYSLKTLQLAPLVTEKTHLTYEKLDALFLRALEAVFDEIFNPDLPFFDAED